MDLSRMFETTPRILTGLELLTSNGPFFMKMGLTLANFISSGTMSELMDLLKMIEVGVLRNSALSLIKGRRQISEIDTIKYYT